VNIDVVFMKKLYDLRRANIFINVVEFFLLTCIYVWSLFDLSLLWDIIYKYIVCI